MEPSDTIRTNLVELEGGVVLYAVVDPPPWGTGAPPPPVFGVPSPIYDPLVYSLGYENPTGKAYLLQLYDAEGNEISSRTLAAGRSEITYEIPASLRPRLSSGRMGLSEVVRTARRRK